jgi:hypothetical protein
MGWIMPRVILILLFYLIFIPIGLSGRIFGKRFLETNFDKIEKSYW